MEEHSSGWWLLENASAQPYGAAGDSLILWMHVVMFALFIGWGIYYVLVLFKFRARRGHEATNYKVKGTVNKGIEIGVVVVEAVLLLGISIPAWSEFKVESPQPGAIEINVIAKQFAWMFHYPGKDGVFGRTSIDVLDAENPFGLDREGDPYARDDIWSTIMRVPKGKPIFIKLRSLDVIHSLGIPKLRVKQDAVPGMNIPIWFEPAVVGTFEIACSQLCGNGHSTMRGFVKVLEQPAYEKWLEEEHAELGLDDDATQEAAE